MNTAPDQIVSVVLGVIIVTAIVLWASFIFAPAWLDRVLVLFSF